MKNLINKINCMDAYELLDKIPDNSVDLVVTDPPYKQDVKSHSYSFVCRNFQKREDKLVPLSNFNPSKFLDLIVNKCKIFNAYIWCNKNLLTEYINFAVKNNFSWDILIWSKINPIPAYNTHYLGDIEYCLFIREKGAYFNNKLGFENYFKVMKDKVLKRNNHPTSKPLWMISKMIKVSSKEGDLILDPFMGAWTTAKACQELGRNFIGSELDKEYCDIGRDRLNEVPLFNF